MLLMQRAETGPAASRLLPLIYRPVCRCEEDADALGMNLGHEMR